MHALNANRGRFLVSVDNSYFSICSAFSRSDVSLYFSAIVGAEESWHGGGAEPNPETRAFVAIY